VEGKNDLFVLIDPLILQNVVEGLLRNAVENTPDGGTIRLGVEQKHEEITLHVTDDGVGITEQIRLISSMDFSTRKKPTSTHLKSHTTLEPVARAWTSFE